MFKLPRAEGAGRARELRASELAMILDGIDVSRLKRLPRYQRRARITRRAEALRREGIPTEKDRDVCNHIRIATSNVMCLPLTHLLSPCRKTPRR